MKKELENDILEILLGLDSLDDKQAAHKIADKLLCLVLVENGYKKIVRAFEKVQKWYA